MTDIEAKARDMVRKEDKNGLLNFDAAIAALCRAIEQHEAFKQKVSDAVGHVLMNLGARHWAENHLNSFIIPKPKPDPLVDAIESVLSGFESRKHAESYAHHIRAKLENSGFEIEIREKGQ
jgi:hypothetical protein